MTDKEALKALQRRETPSNAVLESLSRRGLIKVSDVTNNNTPQGQREWLFINFTERGRKVLEG
jgi:hypothetical protein